MFNDFFRKGLAYRKESMVNWDPVDNTVLANEQVIDGKGWRTGAPVERRKLSQWFLKITDYAEDLIDGLKTLERWPEKVRIMQENWIGKSRGLQFKSTSFPPPRVIPAQARDLPGTTDKDSGLRRNDGDGLQIEVFTTRPDTLFGASFVGIAPRSPVCQSLRGRQTRLRRFHQTMPGRRHLRSRHRTGRKNRLRTPARASNIRSSTAWNSPSLSLTSS